MTNPPMGEPAYAPPQDPWAGTQGMAAAPTDPLPQAPPAYGQFAPGVATPSAPSWSQDTIAQGDPYGYVPQRSSGVGKYIVVVILVLLLGGGGGFGAWYFITNRYDQQLGLGQGTSATPSASATTSVPVAVVPSELKVGDCIFDVAPQGADQPVMVLSPCDRNGALKIVSIFSGVTIPEGPGKDGAKGTFDDTTYNALCKTRPGAYYFYDDPDDAGDWFFCASVVKTAA
jgi:hypothetical protein